MTDVSGWNARFTGFDHADQAMIDMECVCSFDCENPGYPSRGCRKRECANVCGSRKKE